MKRALGRARLWLVADELEGRADDPRLPAYASAIAAAMSSGCRDFVSIPHLRARMAAAAAGTAATIAPPVRLGGSMVSAASVRAATPPNLLAPAIQPAPAARTSVGKISALYGASTEMRAQIPLRSNTKASVRTPGCR